MNKRNHHRLFYIYLLTALNLAQSETEHEQTTKTNVISRKYKSQLELLDCNGDK